MNVFAALVLAAVWAAAALSLAAADSYKPPLVTFQDSRMPQRLCSHPLYCDGPILKRIQLAGVFDEDKTFVDMPTRQPVDAVVAAFNKLPANATKAELAAFVDSYFYPAGCDIVEAELDDWTDDPPFL
ncbi:hypothetical protein GGI04_005903, partial [Coemansia thaxteri]